MSRIIHGPFLKFDSPPDIQRLEMHEAAKARSSLHLQCSSIASYDSVSPSFSLCSVSSGMGSCLNNIPPKQEFVYPTTAPGQAYDADEQCRFQYGVRSRQCKYAVSRLSRLFLPFFHLSPYVSFLSRPVLFSASRFLSVLG